MAPPQLAGDAPVADVVHPFVIGLEPVLRNEFDAAILNGRYGFGREWLGFDKPLRGHQRLDGRVAALAFADAQRIGLDFFNQSELLEIGHDPLARLEGPVSDARSMSMAPGGPNERRPIGVFDSGVGGLTVVRALRAALPGEDIIYLGDTARVPYGNKSPRTVEKYSLGCQRFLLDRGGVNRPDALSFFEVLTKRSMEL